MNRSKKSLFIRNRTGNVSFEYVLESSLTLTQSRSFAHLNPTYKLRLQDPTPNFFQTCFKQYSIFLVLVVLIISSEDTLNNSPI